VLHSDPVPQLCTALQLNYLQQWQKIGLGDILFNIYMNIIGIATNNIQKFGGEEMKTNYITDFDLDLTIMLIYLCSVT
jgi:hypothetical protein